MRIAIKIALWTLATILVLLTSLFLYLRSADLSVYEDRIEGALSNAIGHKVDVDGLFELRFGSLTHLVAEDVRVTNANWPEDPELFRAGHLSVTIDIWSVLSSPLIVDNLVARDVGIFVRRDESGAANWDREFEKVVTETKREPRAFNADLIAFREVRLENINLFVDEPDRDRPLDFTLAQLTINPDLTGVLDLNLSGDINGVALLANGQLGPWRNLINASDLAADLDLTLGEIQLSVEGNVDDLSELEGLNLDMSLDGPAIDRITNIFGLPPFASGAFHVDGESRRVNGINQIRLTGNLGEISLLANGNVDFLLNPDEVQFDFNFSGPDSEHVAAVFGIEGAPAVPFRLTGDVQIDDARIEFSGTTAELGNNSITLEGWLDFNKTIPDGDVVISASGPNFAAFGPFIGLPGIPQWEFNMAGRMQKTGRRVHFENLLAMLGPNRIEANGAIDPEGGAGTEVFVSISGPDISFIQGMANLPDVPAKPFSASAYLRPDPIGINLDDAKLKVGDNEAEIDGVIGTLDGADGTDVTVHAFGPELHNVSLLTGIPYLPYGEYDYRAKISIAREILSIDYFDLTVVGASGSASGTVNIGRNAGDFDLQIVANSDDVSQLELFESLKELHGDQLRVNGHLTNTSGIMRLTSVTADIGNLGIGVNGTFDPANLHATLVVNANAPDSEVLDRFMGDRSFPDGRLIATAELERSDDNVEFSNASFRVGDFVAEIDGVLSNSPLQNDSDLDFRIAGPDLDEFLQTFGIDTLPPKTFEFAGEVNGTPTGFAIENLDAHIGENAIEGRITADLRGKPAVTGTISATYIDLASQLDRMEERPKQKQPGPYVIPDDPLAVGWLETFDANIDLRAERLLLTQLDVHDFLLGFHVENGALRADPISLGEKAGNIAGHIHLTPQEEAYVLDTEINIENIHVGVLETSGEIREALPPLNGQIKIVGTGKTAHEIMASANGRIDLTQGAGRTNNTFAARFFGDLITEIINTLNPLRTSRKYTNLECAFYVVGIEDGLATFENVIMQTDTVTLGAEGTVNFKDESLRISASAAPRRGIGVSVGSIANSFMNVRGTLKKPSLGLDATGSVTTTGAAVATGGLSLLAKGLWDRMRAERSICDALPEERR